MSRKVNPFLENLTNNLEEDLKFQQNTKDFKVDTPIFNSQTVESNREEKGAFRSSFGEGTSRQGGNFFQPITSSTSALAQSRVKAMEDSRQDETIAGFINRKTDDMFETLAAGLVGEEKAAQARETQDKFWNMVGTGTGNYLDMRLWGVPGMLADADVSIGGFDIAREFQDLTYLGNYKDPEERSGWEAAIGGLGMGIGMLRPIKSVGGFYQGAMVKSGNALRKTSTLASKMGMKTASEYLEGGARRVLGDNKVIKGLLSNYKNKVTKTALAKTVASMGDDALKGITKISSNATNSIALKELTKIGTKGMSKMYDDVAENLLKSNIIPNLSKSGAKDLAVELVQLSMKNSARNTFGVWSRAFQSMGLREGAKGLAGQGLAAATNLFIMGGMYDIGISGFKSLANLGIRGANAIAPEYVDYDKDWYKDPYIKEMHSHNIWGPNHSDFIGVTSNAIKHGKHWAIMSPTHFIGGGRNKWLKEEGSEWWAATKKLWSKNTKKSKMTDEEAINYVKGMEKSMQLEGVTLPDYIKTKVPNISNWASAINGDQARQIIKETQYLAPKMIYKYFIPEIGKDIVGSMPRMVTGNILMNAPNIYEYAKGDYTQEMKEQALAEGRLPREGKSFISAAFDPKAYGNSIQEAVGNVVFAMSIAKHQQNLDMNKPKNGKWWSGGLLWKDVEIRTQPYSDATKKMNMFRKAMNWYDMYDIMPNALDVLPNEIVRTALEQDAEWRPIMETLKDIVVEDPNAHANAYKKGNKPIDVSYMEFIKKSEGRELNAKEQTKLDMALNLLKVYAENGVLLGKEQTRLVSPEKANEIVEKLNNLPGQSKFNADAKGYSEYLVDKLYSNAADNYRVPVQNFLKQIADIFDVRATVDSNTGVLSIQKFDLDFLTQRNRNDGVSNEAVKELNPIVRAFNDKIQEGVKSGYVKVEGENIDVGKLTTSVELDQKIVDIYKGTVKELNDRSYGKESDYFDKDILLDRTMGQAYKVIKDREIVQNVLHLFRPAESKGLQFNTLSEDAIDLVNREILRLRLEEDLPISISKGKAPNTQSKDQAVEFYENLKEVYRKVRGQNKSAVPGGGTKSRSIELREILAAKKNIEEVMGDAFTNKDHMQNIKNEVNNEFFKRMGLEEFGDRTDSRLALSYLIYPEMDARQLGDTTGPIAFAQISKGGNVILPESVKLFELIKQSTDYLTNDITKKRIDEAEVFYKDLELTVKSSGSSKFKFSTDPDVFQELLKKYGGSGVSDMLHEAQFRSRLGKIRDAKDAHQNGDAISSQGDNTIDIIKNRLAGLKDAKDAGLLPSNQEYLQQKVKLEKAEKLLTELVQESRDLWEIIQEAQITGDFKELIRMEQIDKSYSGFNKSLEKLLSIDISREGNINTEYMQEIATLVDKAQQIRRNKVGDVDVNSLKRFYEEELKNNSYNLPNFAEKMSVNVTPAEFQQRYNITSNRLDGILNKVSESLNQSGRGEVTVLPNGKLKINLGKQQDIIDGFYELLGEVQKSHAAKQKNYGSQADKNVRSDADMITDTYQILTSHLLRKKIKKVTYNKQELELSEVYTQYDPERGISGIDAHLGLKGRGYYEFGQEITFIDPISKKEKRGVVYADYVENLNVQLEGGKTVLINKQQQIDFMQGKNLSKQVEPPITGEKFVKVDFGEGAEYIFNINKVVPKIKASFEVGGPLRQRLAEILGVDKSTIYSKRFNKIIKDMTADNPNTEQIKNNLQTIHNILNRADLIIEGNISNKEAKNVIKVRKLDTVNRGKTLTDEQFMLAKEVYNYAYKNKGLKEFKEINDIYQKLGDKISDKRIKSISIDDASGNMLITNLMKKAYSEDLAKNRISQKEHDAMISHLESVLDGVSATDAPTFLTREKFLLNLSQLGWRPEWFEFNSQGEITNIKIGAVKPKGAHVEVQDGKVVVSYNKTAFFYDPQLSRAMEKAKIDEVTFKSGSKVHVEYKMDNKTGEYIKTEKYIPSKSEIKESIGDQIVDYIKTAGTSDIVEKTFNSYTIINASKEVKATVGANSGIHFSHDAGVLEWMNTDANFGKFKQGLLKIKDSPYSATDIMKQILKMDESLGDAEFTKQSYEYMIANDGLLLSPWMGDVASEKIFNYFYKGGKISSGSVESSSYNVMAPNLWSKFSGKRLPIRIGGTQRRFGENVGNSFQLNQKFTKVGFVYGEGDIGATGSNFVFEHSFKEPGGGKYKADVLIGYDVNEKPVVYVNGYEIRANGSAKLLNPGVVNREAEGYQNRLKFDGKIEKDNKLLYENAIKELERIETLLAKDYGDKVGSKNSYIGNTTNSDVIRSLRDNRNVMNGNTYMVTLETRQPRNSMADVVINTIPYSTLDAKINKRGNQSNQNMIDLAKTQDADMDFDKSNSYLAAPSKYVREAVKNSGVEVSGDSYAFADHLIRDLQVSLQNGGFKNQDIATWLQDHKGSELLRGRFVKMHNIMTYFTNAFPEGGNILSFKDVNNQAYTVRFKGGYKYTTAADQVSHWVKIFIDNYKKSPKHGRQMTEDLVSKLMMGDGYRDPINGSKRMYEGLFEVVDSKGKVVKNYIPTEFGDVRGVIMDKMIRPISSYLRFNRGEMQEGISNKTLTLKDIALGYTELKNNLQEGITSFDANKGLFKQLSFYKTPGFERQIDIREGVKSLDLFISEISNSPFDRMMKNVNEAYFESLNLKPKSINEFTDFIFKMENEYIHRLTEQSGVSQRDMNKFKLSYSEKFQGQLYDYVMKDFDLAKVTVLKQKLASLKDKKQWMESEPRDQNSKSLTDLAERINLLSESVNDLEIRIQGDIQRSKNWNVFTGFKAGEGNLSRKDINRVIYTTNGKIKEVIKANDVNKIEIKETDLVVENARRFEVEHADKQEYLHARLMAFGNSEPTTRGKNANDFDRRVVQNTANMWNVQQGELLKELKKTQEGGNGISVQKYVSDSKVLLHNILNGLHSSEIQTPLQRKMLLWKLLTPNLSQVAISSRRTHDGQNFFGPKYYDSVSADKIVTSYLLEVGKGTGFGKIGQTGTNNQLTRAEALRWLAEIGKRQHLSYIGITNPELNVSIDPTPSGNAYFKNKNNSIGQIRQSVYENQYMGKDIQKSDHALHVLNQFAHGGRMLTPFDLRRLSKMVERGVAIEDIIEYNQGFDRSRKYGVWGKNNKLKMKTPTEEVIDRIKHLKECIGGTN